MWLAYLYPISLAVISLFVMALEALFPYRKQQKQLRARLWSDFLHLVFNGHFLGIILFGVATHYVLPHVDKWLTSVGWMDAVYRNAASAWPIWLQIIVALVVVDFVQWAVHNLLHRVSFLWEFHKTHHSIQDGEMDWIVSFRFQWTEVVVYKSILYLPLAFFGFGQEAVLFHAIFGTLIGHLNHANLNWDWGPLKYVLNSPNMHIWHHDYEGDEKSTVNFGIIFSTWDWIFGTAKMPDHPPAHLGFHGVETFPDNFFSQAIWPMQRVVPALTSRQALASVLGVVLLSAGWAFHTPFSPQTQTPMFGEPVAASQPSVGVVAPPEAYGADEAARAQALGHMGDQARKDGFAHPESMVSVPELAAALGHPRLVLLDVRPTERYEEGHIPTAHQLYRGDYSTKGEPAPGLSLDAEALRKLLSRLGVKQGDQVVAYTDGGPEAYRLWWTLRQVAGISIRVLDGGLQQWKAQGHGLAMGDGLPVEAAPLLAAPSTTSKHLASWSDAEAFLKAKPGAVLLDTRGQDEYLGKEQHKNARRKGHIPGAKHLNWYSVVRSTEDDYRLQTPQGLKELFAKQGVTDKTPVLTYCQSGTRSAGVFFALYQMGRQEKDLMNYDGSWAEYSRTDLPVEVAGP